MICFRSELWRIRLSGPYLHSLRRISFLFSGFAFFSVESRLQVCAWTDFLTLPSLASSRGGRKRAHRQENDTKRRCQDWISGLRAELWAPPSRTSPPTDAPSFTREPSVARGRLRCGNRLSLPQTRSCLTCALFIQHCRHMSPPVSVTCVALLLGLPLRWTQTKCAKLLPHSHQCQVLGPRAHALLMSTRVSSQLRQTSCFGSCLR